MWKTARRLSKSRAPSKVNGFLFDYLNYGYFAKRQVTLTSSLLEDPAQRRSDCCKEKIVFCRETKIKIR